MGLRMIQVYVEKKHITDKINFDAELKSFSFPHGIFEDKELNNT